MSSEDQIQGGQHGCYGVHEGFLRRYVGHYLRDKNLAEDLVQDAFLRFQEVSQWEVIEHPRAYLTRIARNLIVDYWRQSSARERMQRVSDLGEMIAAQEVESSPYEDVAPRLEAALECLPWKQRQIVKQHYLQGKPYAQLAVELGMNVATVKVASMRGRRKLRSILEKLVDQTDS